MGIEERKEPLTDLVKAAIADSGLLTKLKVTANEGVQQHNNNQQALQPQARAAISEIQDILSTCRNDRASAKLMGMLAKLQNALEQGTLSSASITAALSEATSAMNSSDENTIQGSVTPQQEKEKIWLQVATHNKEINDDFEKMQKAGVHFNDGLLNRHKQLMEELAAHPQDIKKQKELDAVDDAMLMQAEKQLDKSPDAKASFDDASQKSKERHQLVDKALEALNTNLAKANDKKSLFDADAPPLDKVFGDTVTMDDVKAPAGKKLDLNEEKFVRKQTNVHFRIKSSGNPTSFITHRTRNVLIYAHLSNINRLSFDKSVGKFCSKINVGLLHNGFCLTQRCPQPLRKTKDEKSNHVLSGINGQTSGQRTWNRCANQGS
jgi:hypothetical protein